MTAKEYLSRYREINVRIDNKREKIAQLRAHAVRVSQATVFDRNGDITDRVGRSAIKIADLEGEIQEMKKKAVNIRAEIMQTISKLDDEQLRVLLKMRYIHGYSWRKIAGKLRYSEDHVRGYLHGRALQKLTHLGIDFNT